MVNKFYKSNLEKVYVDGKWRLVYQKHKSKKLYIKRKGEYVYLSKKMRGGLINGAGDADDADADKYIIIDIEEDVVFDFLVAQINDKLKVIEHLYISKNSLENDRLIIDIIKYNILHYSNGISFSHKFKHINDNILMVLYNDQKNAIYTYDDHINVYMFAIKNKNDGNKYFLAIFKKDDINNRSTEELPNKFTLEVFNTIKEQYHVPTDGEHKTTYEVKPEANKPKANKPKLNTEKYSQVTKALEKTNKIWHEMDEIEKSENNEQAKSERVFVSQPEPNYAPTLCGINGLENGCYMNTALQMFIHMPEFNKAIIKLSEQNKPSKLVKAYVDFLKAYELKNSIDHKILKTIFMEVNRSNVFQGNRQEDVQEFIYFFLNSFDDKSVSDLFKMEETTVNTYDPEQIIKDVNDDNKYYQCSTKTKTLTNSQKMLQIKIPSDHTEIILIEKLNEQIKGTNEEIDKEGIECDDNNLITLDSNNVDKSANYKKSELYIKDEIMKHLIKFDIISRTMKYIITSKILIVTLIIFDNEGGKNFCNVYIHNLWNNDGTNYILKGIGLHKGTTKNSGHYVYFSKEADRWICYNDSNVSIVETIKLGKKIKNLDFDVNENANTYFKLSNQENGINEFICKTDANTNNELPCPYILYYERQD